MKHTFAKALVIVLALLMLATSAVGCGASQPLMTLDGHSLSINLYELMLSIQKGNMAYLINYWYGDVNSPDFWGTVIDDNSTTYDDYYTLAVYKKAKNFLAAVVLFDEMELKLPDATVEAIDEEIQGLIENDGGSKKALNAILAEYGVNIDMYREYKLMEAKSSYLASELYGKGGSKIGAVVKEQYLADNYVAFRQILLANYYYVFETDENGDTVYYQSNGKIAYDTVNGEPQFVEGSFVYYTKDGRIAYDKENGVPSPVITADGQQKVEYYTEAQMLERAQLAIDLKDMAAGSEPTFRKLREAYSDEELADGSEKDTLCYLATNVDYASVYNSDLMDTIADTLSGMAVGEIAIIQSDYGYHIVRRYATEKGAYADSNLSGWFSDSTYGVFDFMNNLENDLFLKVLAPYADRVQSDDALLDSISLKSVAPNHYYK